ncbi:non-canonical purine NTP pyrophosphatase [Clostridia bacterium]|nr:non-canonical purine NTP pyrophosphatase [Clostridia bacterium]
MQTKYRLIFATSNLGKRKEVEQMLQSDRLEILSLVDLGLNLDDVKEDGETFWDNAKIKMYAIAKKTDFSYLVLADDSGLEIDALNKKPGVHSSRYLGEDTSYEEKNQSILKQLAAVTGENRSARFLCEMALFIPQEDKIFRGSGVLEGRIANYAQGENGFGYDPIFYLEKKKKTLAQLSASEKNQFSHRKQALQKVKEELEVRKML